MDGETSTRLHVGLLERVVLDENAEPTYVPLSLLEDITNCFSDENQIGSGGFAVVYKGIVGKGMVAVKKLSRTFDLLEQKFHKEVECLAKAKHKNIVRFLGYCSETQGRIASYEEKFVMADIRNWLLCFEYVPNGTLDKYIIDASRGLEWKERYKIIKGVCEGLAYLHKENILHLDLKPGNILVDEHMVPKITDFGLSRCLEKGQTRDFTSTLRGSLGYFPLECYGGQVAKTSDIYSLGVIIVEILTGNKGYPEAENVVENWRNRLEGSDQRDMQLEQVKVCTKIGMECMDSDPKMRPDASHIVDRLEKTPSIAETGISSSSVEQKVSLLNDRQGEFAKFSPEYLGKDIKEHVETEELGEYVGTPRKDHWQHGQEDAQGGQWSLWEAQYTKQNGISQGASICSSNSGLLYKLNKLDIFNIKARENYIRHGGPSLENLGFVMLFRKEEVKPFLNDKCFLRKDGFGDDYEGMFRFQRVTVRKASTGTVIENVSFINEVIVQTRVIHKNIVRLIGCCLESDVPMLVHEFFSRVSLHDILHLSNEPLNLGQRLIIAAESACGLAFMHSPAETQILNGDVKPEYILLDEYYRPKISDFGISKMIGRYYEQTGRIIDDKAYMDPVYLQTGQLTAKSDVYSIGVVILELLTRKKATYTDNYSLVREFLENHWQGRKSTELFDKEIAVARDLDLLDDLAEIAVKCLNFDRDLRPTMTEVAEHLTVLSESRER